ncbi:AAA family ATPase [Nocardioides sp. GCM10030258]|uniref:AAA family ATPase n=1 Tax=unclassified Nocardioides TaxID=2615069 RepID=UPI0036086F16
MPDSTWYDGLTLRSWQLKNFKSVENAEIPLAPLTVIVGANSAGKSTLLQSIRVAAQAANSNGDYFPLNADQIRLGTFEETRFAGAHEDEPIQIGGCFHMGTADFYQSAAAVMPYGGAARRRFRRPRDVVDNTNLKWDLTLHGTPEAQSAATRIIAVEVTASVDDEERASFRAARSAEPSPVSNFGHELQYDGEVIEDGELVADAIDANIVGGFPRAYLHTEAVAEILFWNWYAFRADEVKQNVRPVVSHGERHESADLHDQTSMTPTDELARIVIEDLTQIAATIPDETWNSPGIRRTILMRLREYYSDHPERLDNDIQRSQVGEVFRQVLTNLSGGDRLAAQVSELPDLLQDAINEAQEFLATRVQHLGPLRMDPKVVYTSSPSGNLGFIGMKGEYTTFVLHNNERQRVANSPHIPGTTARPQTLLAAVNRWATYLGIAEEFETEDRGRLGLQLSVRQPGVDRKLDLTDVGTGVSQILPVLVMCLQAPPGSLLLIEQPELHLNPGVQQRLADFLLAVAHSGRQLIIETHSDYLVTRLRRKTAEDKSGATRDRIALIFAEREESSTKYDTVKPQPDGSMTNWPRAFYDDAADDSKALVKALLDSLDD